jgi:hypothetical protein
MVVFNPQWPRQDGLFMAENAAFPSTTLTRELVAVRSVRARTLKVEWRAASATVGICRWN